MNLPALQQVIDLVTQAGDEEIMPRYQRVGCDIKTDGSLLTEADLAVDQRLQQALAQHWPKIRFLSEEMSSEEQTALLQDDGPLWILDPLDGTSNFAAGLPFFAVSLALVHEGKTCLAVTYDPFRKEIFSAELSKGAWLNDEALQAPTCHMDINTTVAIVDFKRLPSELKKNLAHNAPYNSQRNLGSCALEWCWIAAGRGHLYLHGGMKLWDYAAGVLILSEAGASSSTMTGEPVFVAKLEPRSVVLARDKTLFDAWFSWLSTHKGAVK